MGLLQVLLACILSCWLANIDGIGAVRNMTRSEVLRKVFSSYEKRLSPNFDDGNVTEVKFNLWVTSFDSISETTMDYMITVFVRQSWTDKRLAYGHLLDVDQMELDPSYVSSIWVPDLFFHNEKKAYFHDVTVPNRLLRIYSDGRVYYSARTTLTLSCPMQLQKFPLDTQRCPIFLESYAFSSDMMKFSWQGNAVQRSADLEIPQFELEYIDPNVPCHVSYGATGDFPCLRADFVLRRNRGYYIIQMYVPTFLVVVLSWVSFWLNIEAVPARISLGVLTVLTMSTQASSVRQSLPRVSYIKAIDVWMSMCLVFVFAGLIEFAFVNVVSRRDTMVKIPCSKPNAPAKETDAFMNDGQDKKASKYRTEGRRQAHLIDKWSRYMFPLAFFLFNLGYWLGYLADEY